METIINKFALLMPIMLLFACNHPILKEDALPPGIYSDPKTQNYSARELLKNWALSRCFGTITQDKNTRDDAYATAGGYFEYAVYSLEAFEDLDELVKRYVRKKYSGSIPSEFNTMKCIDMFHSQELEKLVDDWIKK